jgi:hypothetical protein
MCRNNLSLRNFIYQPGHFFSLAQRFSWTFSRIQAHIIDHVSTCFMVFPYCISWRDNQMGNMAFKRDRTIHQRITNNITIMVQGIHMQCSMLYFLSEEILSIGIAITHAAPHQLKNVQFFMDVSVV